MPVGKLYMSEVDIAEWESGEGAKPMVEQFRCRELSGQRRENAIPPMRLALLRKNWRAEALNRD